MTLGAENSWEDVDVAAPDVKWDASLNKWVMVYSGFNGSVWGTGIATADNLTGPWTKHASNPVMTPNEHETYLCGNGSIVKVGSTYYHYYQCGANELHAATSTDLVTWTRANSGNAILGADGGCGSQGIFDFQTALSPDGTQIILYYGMRTDSQDQSTRKIAKAVASTSAPLTFAFQGLILDAPTAYNFGAPSPVKFGGNPCIFTDEAASEGARYVGYWYMSGAGYTNFICLEPTGVGWESVQVSDVSAVLYNGTVYLFYCGAPSLGGTQGMNDQIGLATWTPE